MVVALKINRTGLGLVAVQGAASDAGDLLIVIRPARKVFLPGSGIMRR